MSNESCYIYPIVKHYSDLNQLVWEVCEDLSKKGVDNYVSWEYNGYIELRNNTKFFEAGRYKIVIDFIENCVKLEKIEYS